MAFNVNEVICIICPKGNVLSFLQGGKHINYSTDKPSERPRKR